MVVKVFHSIREDGVTLVKRFDAKADEFGILLMDVEGNYIPSGFKIQKVVVTWNKKRIPKNEFYDEAIDVENAPYEYLPTDIPVEIPEDNKGNIPE